MPAEENTHIYVDLDIINNDQRADVDPPQLRFEETRNSPFLPGDSHDYFCSIVRFSIQTGNSLPIFIPRIRTGQSNPNLTVYSVTIRNPSANDERTVTLIYESWNLTAPTPPAPTDKQDVSTEYYFVKSYDHFLQMINRAVKTCYYNLVSGYADFNFVYRDLHPFMQFDPQTGLFAFLAPQDIFDPSTPNNKGFELYFNTRLYQLMSTFPSKFAGNQGEKNYRIVFDSLNGQSFRNRRPYVMTLQEVSTVALWNPVASIVFTTSLLPVVPDNASSLLLFYIYETGFRYWDASYAAALTAVLLAILALLALLQFGLLERRTHYQ